MHTILLKEITFITDQGRGPEWNKASLSYTPSDKSYRWFVEKESHKGYAFLAGTGFSFSVEEMDHLMDAYSRYPEMEIIARHAIIEEIEQKAKSVGRRATTGQINGIIKAAEEYCSAVSGSDVNDIIKKLADITYKPKEENIKP